VRRTETHRENSPSIPRKMSR